MKILKIESNKKNNCGKFLNPTIKNPKDDDYKMIETITSKDVFDMIDYMMENDVEMDDYNNPNNQLPNPVQKTIYTSLYQNFTSIINKKEETKSEVNKEFETLEREFPSVKENDKIKE